MPKFNFDLVIHVYCMPSLNSYLLTMLRKQTIQADIIKHCESVNALQIVLKETTTLSLQSLMLYWTQNLHFSGFYPVSVICLSLLSLLGILAVYLEDKNRYAFWT